MSKRGKQRDDNLQETGLLYRTLFEQSPDGVLIIDTEGRIIQFNEAAHLQLGYTREEFQKLGISDIDPDQHPDEIRKSIGRVLRDGKATLEVRHRTKDGAIRDVQVITQAIAFADRTVLHTIWRDVTEQRQYEEKLLRSEERYRALFEESPISLWEEDCSAVKQYIDRLRGEGVEDFRVYFDSHPGEVAACMPLVNVLDVNRATLNLFKAEEKKQLFCGLDRIFTEESLMHFKEQLIAIAEGKTVLESEVVNRTLTGEKVHAVLRWSLCTGFEDTCSKVLVSVVDIGGRKQREEMLRESEDFLHTIFETVPECVKLVGPDSVLLMTNRIGLKMIETDSLDEVKGKSVYHLISPEYHDAFRELSRNVFEGRRGTLEFEMVGLKGRRLFVETHAVPLNNEKGEIIAMLGTTRDITEKKKMEAEIMRTQKIESVGVLAGGIAHDFNNLLTAIIGNVSLAKAFVDPADKVHKRLTEAEKASFRARDLTQQLLTFSKGGTPVKKVASLEGIIREAAGFALRGSNVKCEFAIADGLWPAEVDEGQISQVIHNLIINADQAMPQGGVVRVVCRNFEGPGTELQLKEGKYVKLTVEDRGIGIPKEHLPRIFDPYFTTKQKGSGLGLAAAYSIIRRHDGYVTVESKQGVGSSFHLYLPASDAEVPAAVERKEGLISGKGRVLVMDDEEIVRNVTGTMLESLGYAAEFADDGEAAIEQYTKAIKAGRPYDVLIIDLTIPGGMGGKEAIRKLREIDPRAKAIVSSGYSNDPVMADFVSYGFIAVLSKPYEIRELSETLRMVMSATD